MDKINLVVSPSQLEWIRRDNEIVGVRVNMNKYHIFEHPALHHLFHEEMKKDDIVNAGDKK